MWFTITVFKLTEKGCEREAYRVFLRYFFKLFSQNFNEVQNKVLLTM